MFHYFAILAAAVVIGALASVCGIIVGRMGKSLAWGMLTSVVVTLGLCTAMAYGILATTPGDRLPPGIRTQTDRAIVNLGVIVAIPCVAWSAWNTWWNLRRRPRNEEP